MGTVCTEPNTIILYEGPQIDPYPTHRYVASRLKWYMIANKVLTVKV